MKTFQLILLASAVSGVRACAQIVVSSGPVGVTIPDDISTGYVNTLSVV